MKRTNDYDCGEAFRDRLRNWGRIYRDVKRPRTSNIYPILRQLWLVHGMLENNSLSPAPGQIADADLINHFIAKLEVKEQAVLVEVYANRRSLSAVARKFGDFTSVCHRRLKKSEYKLSRLVADFESP